MTDHRLKDAAERLRALHGGEQPLVLPNAWDAASAQAVVEAGFPVVATTSGGVSASLGWPDREQVPPAEMFAAIGRIARAVDVPVTADIEGGYGLAATELVDALLAAGAAGCNLEDTDHAGGGSGLLTADAHAERIAAVKDAGRAAGVDIVVNARIDVFVRQAAEGAGAADLAFERAVRYLDAGADCVYPIGAPDDALVELVKRIPGPVNGMVRPAPASFSRLLAMGLARISFASTLHRAAMAGVRERLAQIAADGAVR